MGTPSVRIVKASDYEKEIWQSYDVILDGVRIGTVTHTIMRWGWTWCIDHSPSSGFSTRREGIQAILRRQARLAQA